MLNCKTIYKTDFILFKWNYESKECNTILEVRIFFFSFVKLKFKNFFIKAFLFTIADSFGRLINITFAASTNNFSIIEKTFLTFFISIIISIMLFLLFKMKLK